MSKLVALLWLLVVVYMYMFCLNFIVGSNFIFLLYNLIIYFTIPKTQRKKKIEPRTKLNHNIYSMLSLIFVFLLFLGMVMYANEVETKAKIKISLNKNINYNIKVTHFNPTHGCWSLILILDARNYQKA